MKCLNIAGLILGFVGAFLAFLDSWRMEFRDCSKRALPSADPRYRTSLFGVYVVASDSILLTVGFLLQLVATFAS